MLLCGGVVSTYFCSLSPAVEDLQTGIAYKGKYSFLITYRNYIGLSVVVFPA